MCLPLSDGVYLLRAWGWGHAPAGSWTVGYWLVTGSRGVSILIIDEGESGSLVICLCGLVLVENLSDLVIVDAGVADSEWDVDAWYGGVRREVLGLVIEEHVWFDDFEGWGLVHTGEHGHFVDVDSVGV